jgi:hypothetical protein
MPSLDKAAHEVTVFKEFVAKSRLPIDVATIESREPDEPDIRCLHDTDGPIAFELVQPRNREERGGPNQTRHRARIQLDRESDRKRGLPKDRQEICDGLPDRTPLLHGADRQYGRSDPSHDRANSQ